MAVNSLKQKMVKLWENQSPTSTFLAQTINLDLTGYLAVLVCFAFSTTSPDVGISVAAPVDGLQYQSLRFASVGASLIMTATMRDFTARSNGIEFRSEQSKPLNSTSPAATENNRMIPIKIYGIRG